MVNIVRITKDKDFTAISNKLLNNKDLSWQARGLLCYMLTKPNNREFNNEHLEEQSIKDGRTVIENVKKELIELWHLVIETIREKWRFKTLRKVYEKGDRSRFTATIKPPQLNRRSSTAAVNQPLVNTDKRVNTELVNKTSKDVYRGLDLSFLSECIKEPFKHFIDTRINLKSKPTQHAIELLESELKRLSLDEKIQVKIINQSITKSRKGLFPLKEEEKTKQELSKEINERIIRQKSLSVTEEDDGFDNYLSE